MIKMSPKELSMPKALDLSSKVNMNVFVTLLLIFLIGGCCGWLAFGMFGGFTDKVQVLYVSRSEIMDMERARLEQEQNPEGRMFFGEIDKAISLIRQKAKSYEDQYHRLIFVGDSYVEGKNARSISKQVYENVINQLGENKYVKNKG